MLSEWKHLSHEGWITTKRSSSAYVRSLPPSLSSGAASVLLGITPAKCEANLKDDECRHYCRPFVRFFGPGVAVGCISGRGSIPSTNAADSASVPEKQIGNSRVNP